MVAVLGAAMQLVAQDRQEALLRPLVRAPQEARLQLPAQHPLVRPGPQALRELLRPWLVR